MLPPITTSYVPAYLSVALGEYGQKEIAGKGSNPRIDEYLRSTTLPAAVVTDDTPWCSAFVNWCFVSTGFKGTNSAAARSWLTYGRRLNVPALGCVAVLVSSVAPADPARGHVGLYICKRGGVVYLLGGNQSNGVCIQAFPTGSVLDYRAP